MAWPRIFATDRTSILSHDVASGRSGMVFDTMTFSIGEPLMRSIAGGENTGWVQAANTRLA